MTYIICSKCGFNAMNDIEAKIHSCSLSSVIEDFSGMENTTNKGTEVESLHLIKCKYKENIIIYDFKRYLERTYKGHYNSNNNIECFDAWIALGDATPTFRNTAIKYLWRLKRKEDTIPKDDLMKAMHYVLMCLYNEYYRIEN
jgi:hypothetical protein